LISGFYIWGIYSVYSLLQDRALAFYIYKLLGARVGAIVIEVLIERIGEGMYTNSALIWFIIAVRQV
jgi:hypothetical protein